uniref:Intraflagellar transport 20 homolog (Chlamydomonas) n=1 Tax=Gasterosteus aculeatus aculeatus TaxID=481459 RepID=A0AAQ4PBR9_GASAC
MAKDPLAEAGFYVDELNKLRVLDPDVSQKTSELKEECKEFVDSKHGMFSIGFYLQHQPVLRVLQAVLCFSEISQFQKIVGGLIELVDELAKEAETEKMKAIGARNLLKSVAKQREAQQQQLQALIAEKKMQLERYHIEYEALSKVESEQNEFIDQFILQK